ncbi:MAG: methyltransferase domain-containing protein [Bacteroidales bacterium]|nr:methyltransferase domain-containing protein [Bacteroidales bacterium]
MDKNKAEHFNESASKTTSKSEQIIEALNIQSNDNIIDFGSGGGFYSNKFAQKVGDNGKVYAVDKNKDLLDYVQNKSKFNNIIPVLLSENELPIEKGSINLIFMRNVTHHLKKRVNVFKQLGEFLTENGKFSIIDYKKGKLFSFHGLFGHSVNQQKIEKEMIQAGFKVFKKIDLIEHQHFTIFEKN